MVCESVLDHNRPIITLAPDLARLAIAAGELAEAVDRKFNMDQFPDIDEALTRFRAIAEGKE